MPRRPARKSAARRKSDRDRRAAGGLVALLAAFALLAVLLALPPVQNFLFTVTGIQPEVQVPAAGTEGDPAAAAEADPTVAVHFIDIGQGDATLIESDGEFALVDAGPPEGADALLAYLQAAGATTLRYLVMSHPHADHIGGMQAVVEGVPVQEVLLPDFSLGTLPTTALFENLLAAMTAKDLSATQMAAGAQYPLGTGTLAVLHGGLESPDNLNEICPALFFQRQAFTFLSTGDSEKANEKALLEEGTPVAAQLFKAAHHGSKTSNTPAFLQAVAPQAVVISCAAGNSYGHPHLQCLETFEAAGAATYRTDTQGSVVVRPTSAGTLSVAVQNPAAATATLPPAA